MFEMEKPLPNANEDTEPYWNQCRAGQLAVPLCASCGHRFMPPAGLCPACLGTDLSFEPVSGRATVFSWIVVHKPQHPAFLEDAPYVVAIVELAEGPRMHTTLREIEPQGIRIGLEVEVRFEKQNDEIHLPVFVPAQVGE